MALRMPVVQIPIDDSQFRRFNELFSQYDERLEKMPGVWQKVNKEFRQSTAAILAQNQSMKELGMGDPGKLRQVESGWRSIAGFSGAILGNTMRITQQLLKWGTIVGGGLIGGSLFGVTRMASDTAGYRRSAMGLGMSIGGMRSFDINMARIGNPSSFLDATNQAIMNPALQGPLYAMGVNPNGSTEQVSIAMLKAMRRLAINTPRGMLGTAADSYGLGLWGGATKLQILKNMGDSEFARMILGEGKDRSALGISDPIAQKWTNFTKQMDLAGATIFKTFVLGLAPLEKPLEGLSAAFVKFLTTLMNGPLLKGGIDKLATVFNQFTGKVTSPKFMASVDELVSSTGQIAQAFGKLAGLLGYAKEHPVKAAAKVAFDAIIKAPFEGGEAIGRGLMSPGTPRGIVFNNPGNLKYAGQAGAKRLLGAGGLATFSTPMDGLVALGNQLERYRNRGLTTVPGILSRYAPPGENDTNAYIKDVLARLHVSATAELNLGNPAVLTKLMNAIIRHEQGRNPYGSAVGRAASIAIQDNTGGAVGIIVRHKTGANPVLSAAGLAGVPQ